AALALAARTPRRGRATGTAAAAPRGLRRGGQAEQLDPAVGAAAVEVRRAGDQRRGRRQPGEAGQEWFADSGHAFSLNALCPRGRIIATPGCAPPAAGGLEPADKTVRRGPLPGLKRQ